MSGIIKSSRRFNTVNYDVSIPKQVTFDGQTEPAEVFIIHSRLSTNLYVSQFGSVSDSNYELCVLPNTSNILTVPAGTMEIFIYALSTGIVDVQSFQCDEIFPSDIQKVLNTGIVSSISSAVTVIDGGIATLGSKSDTYTDDETSGVKSIISFIKGIVKHVKGLNNFIQASTNLLGMVQVSSIASGTNNIGKVDVNSISTGTNLIGKVDVNSISAGTNLIGKVDTQKPANVTIYNITLTTAGVEYSQALPTGTKQLIMCIKDGDISTTWNYAFTTLVGNPFVKLFSNQSVGIDNINFTGKTLYLAGGTNGLIVEVTCLHD